MERYRHTGEESSSRRRFIKRVAKGLAVLTAGYYGGDILANLSEQRKEWSEARKRTNIIDNAYVNSNQYNACQKITSGRCEEVMSPNTIAEVREAQMIIEQHKANLGEVKKQIEHSEKRVYQDLLYASFIEAGIGAVIFIANKLTETKSKTN